MVRISTIWPAFPLRTAVLAALAVALTHVDARCQKLDTGFTTANRPIPYLLDRPDFEARLPKDLKEISGLTILDSLYVAAVQDEDGVVYVLEASSGEVVSEHRFGEDGDYEGIEAVGERLFVLRSDGTLFELRDWKHPEVRSVNRYKTGLSSRNDTEGLALSQDGTLLLVACKEYPGADLKGKRTVYGFSLERRELIGDPVLTLDAEAAERFIPEGDVSRAVRRLLDIRRFKPSALAVHPVTGEVYVLSSVSRSLSLFDAESNLLAIVRLDEDMLPQPEGIAFLPNGDMLLSSEGKGGRGHLLRYRYYSQP